MHLETELFDSRRVLAAGTAIPSPDAKIIFTKVPFVQYGQFLLDKYFRQYLESMMVSKKILMMGAQKTPTKKTQNQFRPRFIEHWLLRFKQAIWFAWIVTIVWQERQTHNNIWLLKCWTGRKNKIYKIN